MRVNLNIQEYAFPDIVFIERVGCPAYIQGDDVHAAVVGNCPLAYCRQERTMFSGMAKRRKQIQPLSGMEKAFGQAMRTVREERDISQMTLHVRTGLDRTFISDLERGIQCPSLRTVFRVAKGLGVNPCTLIRRTAESAHFVFPSEETDTSGSRQ